MRTKRASQVEQKAFFIIFKSIKLPKIVGSASLIYLHGKFAEKLSCHCLSVNKKRRSFLIKIIGGIYPSKTIRVLIPPFISWQISADKYYHLVTISHFLIRVIWTVNNIFWTLSAKSTYQIIHFLLVIIDVFTVGFSVVYHRSIWDITKTSILFANALSHFY